MLIKEINELRAELASSKGVARTLEGTLRSTQTLAKMKGLTLDVSMKTSSLTPPETEELDQLTRIIQMQKDEIRSANTPLLFFNYWY